MHCTQPLLLLPLPPSSCVWQAVLSSMRLLVGRLTECLTQQPSAPLDQQPSAPLDQQLSAEALDWDSLEQAHAEFTILADRVVHSYKWTQARVTWGDVLHVRMSYVRT